MFKKVVLISIFIFAGFSTLQAEEISITTLNMGLGGTIKGDKGKDNVMNILNKIVEILRNEEIDILALQDVDFKTDRSGGIDESNNFLIIFRSYPSGYLLFN